MTASRCRAGSIWNSGAEGCTDWPGCTRIARNSPTTSGLISVEESDWIVATYSDISSTGTCRTSAVCTSVGGGAGGGPAARLPHAAISAAESTVTDNAHER